MKLTHIFSLQGLYYFCRGNYETVRLTSQPQKRFLEYACHQTSHLIILVCLPYFSGQKFALLEVKVVLAKLLRRYQITSCIYREDLLFTADLLLRSKNPIKVKLSDRSNENLWKPQSRTITFFPLITHEGIPSFFLSVGKIARYAEMTRVGSWFDTCCSGCNLRGATFRQHQEPCFYFDPYSLNVST